MYPGNTHCKFTHGTAVNQCSRVTNICCKFTLGEGKVYCRIVCGKDKVHLTFSLCKGYIHSKGVSCKHNVYGNIVSCKHNVYGNIISDTADTSFTSRKARFKLTRCKAGNTFTSSTVHSKHLPAVKHETLRRFCVWQRDTSVPGKTSCKCGTVDSSSTSCKA